MANLADLVKENSGTKKGIKSVSAQRGRKRFWDEEPQEEKKKDPEDYERKLRELEEQIKKYQSSMQATIVENEAVKLSKNEKKLISAVEEEIKKQGNDSPVISRNKLKIDYKINQRYLDDSIKGLEAKGLIKRERVAYSPSSYTHKWTLL